jgi:hypothetical protein
MDSLALRHLNHTTIPFADVCGKGASMITFDQVEIGRATEYAAEDADITLRLHQRMISEVERDDEAELHLPQYRTADRRGAAKDRAQRRADRRRAAGNAIGRAGRAHRRAGSQGPRAGRAAVQPRLAQADRRNLLREAETAGGEETPSGAPRPTKKCCKNWPKITRCRKCCWNTAACPS